MSLTPYRQVLALPGVTRLLVFAVLARVPLTASGVILTLHVVTTLHRGYAAAGLIATAATLGNAVGGPWRGRAVDRVGLRRSLVPSVVVATATWALAPFVGYWQLLVLGAVGGVLGLPIFMITRQSLAVLVPGDQRRTAFSLDGIGTELSFIIGPTLGVLAATQLSTGTAMLALAGSTLVSGLALMVLDPPTRSVEGDAVATSGAAAQVHVPRSSWFTPRLASVLAAAVGATVVLAGTDVSIVAHLREDGAVPLTGLVFAAWGIGSTAGGLVYGAVHRELSPFLILLLLAVLTVPVGLAPGPLTLLLTILPAAALCAPLIAATIEGVSRRVPERVRGEAMGWHGAALQVGSAAGAPLAGVAMDATRAASGFMVVGVAGGLIALGGLAAQRFGDRGGAPIPARERESV